MHMPCQQVLLFSLIREGKGEGKGEGKEEGKGWGRGREGARRRNKLINFQTLKSQTKFYTFIKSQVMVPSLFK